MIGLRWKFVKGGAYFATPATPGAQKRVMLCVGRGDGNVTFSRLGEKMYRPEIVRMCGREVSQLKMGGEMYTVSAASEADLQMAANVAEAMG